MEATITCSERPLFGIAEATVNQPPTFADSTNVERPVANEAIGDTEVLAAQALLKRVLAAESATHVQQQFLETARALVLTGSLARNEATLARSNGEWVSNSDADFFLIIRDGARQPNARQLSELSVLLEQRLLDQKFRVQVGINSVDSNYLRNLPRHIATFELRECGEVMWGDPEVLSLIPKFPPELISKEDAWRMLCNRSIELLGSLSSSEISGKDGKLVEYATIKLVLDSATSYLVFRGAYEPTYAARESRLRQILKIPLETPPPFDLERFGELVSRCTWLKVASHSTDAEIPTWQIATDFALKIWHWELVQLTEYQQSATDIELWRNWAGKQSGRDRFRAWVSATRRLRWSERGKNSFRWVQLAGNATPRYWIYLAANTILSQAVGQRSLAAKVSTDEWNRIVETLPDNKTLSGSSTRSLAALAEALTWNYKRFLFGTLA
ncbi:MAG TPA: hypothetical protein VFO34_03795 [Candidatus Acidoferrales bacterium]|nr:hypothetical protein [Candidatus Acidoferrales bacterium]